MSKTLFPSMQDSEIINMLIEYMGKGFLDNIIALFKQDRSLFRFVADMLGDENMRVRLGATALVEELAGEHTTQLRNAVPGIIELLKHENPTIRGDAAYVLGIIKDRSAREALVACLHDSHQSVREVANDALAQIG
jgi:HEAT repeat protein